MEAYAPMTYAAKHDKRFAGIMTDNSEHPLHDLPEFERIKHQALAFEHLFVLAASLESYVDHVQKFPDRVRDFAQGRSTSPPMSIKTNFAAHQCYSIPEWPLRPYCSG